MPANPGEVVEWMNVTAFGPLAEHTNEYLHKGSAVYVEGRLHTESWDSKDGQTHYRTEVLANQALFLDSRRPMAAVPSGEGDDIPL